jgi:hypothetical protein
MRPQPDERLTAAVLAEHLIRADGIGPNGYIANAGCPSCGRKPFSFKDRRSGVPGDLSFSCVSGCRPALIAKALKISVDALVGGAGTEAPPPAAEPAEAPGPESRNAGVQEIIRNLAVEQIREVSAREFIERINERKEAEGVEYLYGPAHAREYPLLIARLAEADRLERPALLALAAALHIFPGRVLADMRRDLAECLAPEPGTTVAPTEHERAKLAESLWPKCERIAKLARILDALTESTERRLGFVGEKSSVGLTYLVKLSAVFHRVPPSGVVKGPSAAGKNALLKVVLAHFPPDSYMAMTSMSERTLIYDNQPLAHRTVVLFEEAGISSDFLSYVIRSLLSEQRIDYAYVDKDTKSVVHLIREGPTNLLTTTTKIAVDPETETRVFSIPTSDAPEHTKKIMERQAARAGGEEDTDEVDPEWHALYQWLAVSEHRAVIPFASKLAGLIPPASVRLRRDFNGLLALIQTHALLHQASRERDSAGRVVANLDDYAVVHGLLGDIMAETSGQKISKNVRETVSAVAALRAGGRVVVNLTDVAKALGLDVSTTSRRVDAAIAAGFLIDDRTHDRQERNLKLAWGATLPGKDKVLLPPPEELKRQPVK